MRQTIREIEVNVAYRWFLGFDTLDKVPYFSTWAGNYFRRFKDTDLFEQIFSHILCECMKFQADFCLHEFNSTNFFFLCYNL